MNEFVYQTYRQHALNSYSLMIITYLLKHKPTTIFNWNCFYPQLPDLRYLDCRVDYSIKTFGAVVNLCKDLGIRHPEELSLCKPLEAAHLKRNYSEFPKRKLPPSEQGKDYVAPVDSNTFIHNSNHFNGSNGSLDSPANPFSCAPVQHTPHRPVQSTPISSPMGVSSSCCFNFDWFGLVLTISSI